MTAAVLIDVISIQDYIFSSNKLKENVGASYLIKSMYEDILKESLKDVVGGILGICSWKKNPDDIKILQGSDYEIGYIGGGNSLLFFKSKDNAADFIKSYSKALLQKAPGLKTAFGIDDNFNVNDYSNSIKRIHENLKKNKSMFSTNTVIPKHGITADCPRSGESAEFCENAGASQNDKQYISAVSKTKLEASEKALQELNEQYKILLSNQYTFTNGFEKLGQSKGENNYIAVVHIDGNNMGEKIKACKNLCEMRKLSLCMFEAVEKSFYEVIQLITEKMKIMGESQNNIVQFSQENGKIVLPLRPIILGGDDLTFVCEGRFGILLSELFLKKYSEHKWNNEPLNACAGICIVKTKYPFYRAYHLAESLCKTSKKRSKENKGESYLDFLISSSGFSGTLEEIRKQYYTGHSGNLHFGPYCVDSSDNPESIKNLKNMVCKFNEWKNSSYLMKLRELLQRADSEELNFFVKKLEQKNLSLPEIPEHFYHQKVFQDRRTPYFDVVESIDFYPSILMDGMEEQS